MRNLERHFAEAVAHHGRAQAYARAALEALRHTGPGSGRRADHAGGPAAPIVPPVAPSDDPGSFVRIGTVATPLGEPAPLWVPLLGRGHLVLQSDSRSPVTEAVVAGVLRQVVAAAATRPDLRILPVDLAGGGRLFAPFHPLWPVRVMSPPVTVRDRLTQTLQEAHRHLAAVRAAGPGRRPPLLVLPLLLDHGAVPQLLAELQALAHAGPEGGLHLVIAGHPPPRGFDRRPPEPLALATHLLVNGARVRLYAPDFGLTGAAGGRLTLPVAVDPAPAVEAITVACRTAAEGFVAATGVTVADLLPESYWTESSAPGLRVPVGRAGAELRTLAFDDHTPHWLVGGRTGQGKTVFLLNLLYALATRFDREQLQMYLLDLKKGVSFNTLRPTAKDPSFLPQAALVGVESDREFAAAVLRHLDEEMDRRSALFKQHEAATYADLRAGGTPLPRILLLVDEFQVLFEADDAVARQAADTLDRLARQARSYGLHVVLASQSTDGILALVERQRSLLGQFGMRIALPGAHRILEDDDSARSIERGVVIVNSHGGAAGQDERLRFPNADAAKELLARVRHELWRRAGGVVPPVVFNGSDRQALPTATELGPHGDVPMAWVGRVVDARLPLAGFPLRATAGRHLAVLGNGPDGGAIVAAAFAGLALQHAPGTAAFHVAAFVETPALAEAVALARDAGHDVRQLDPAGLRSALADSAQRDSGQRTYFVLSGLDALGPALADPGETGRTTAEELRRVIREGPFRGTHVLGWWSGLDRLAEDVQGEMGWGTALHELVGGFVITNIAGDRLGRIFGGLPPPWTPRENRALLVDTAGHPPRSIVPFTAVRPAAAAPVAPAGTGAGRTA
ncbi:FtsK/SpoIIIE domain-containing protein [Micromonospora sp. CPCC 205561]|uniref:FtsK/SpoIIIE domain-containing protein n=1 Tax=Micromonospora sp. CPCC 205561 TaxID=3122407 RepID=UPI002FEFB94C